MSRKKATKAKKKPDFYVWLRSGLRSMSRKWWPVYEALAAAKVPYVGDNKRRQWSYKCAMCSELFESKLVAVDHRTPAGSLACKDDIAGFVERLFCGPEGLQVLCHPCHDAKTLADKHGYSIEEAKLQKEVLSILRNKVADVKFFCSSYGYTEASLSNPAKRRVAVEEILRRVSTESTK